MSKNQEQRISQILCFQRNFSCWNV